MINETMTGSVADEIAATEARYQAFLRETEDLRGAIGRLRSLRWDGPFRPLAGA